jgi:pyruvate dehydrogenase E1 component
VRRMLKEQEDVYYYITVMNENYAHPDMPKGAEADIIKGMYLFRDGSSEKNGNGKGKGSKSIPYVQLLGSGTILREVIAAAELLASDWSIAAEVWSATSFSELAREAREVERFNRLHPAEPARTSHVQRCLAGDAPVIAASDYVRAWPQLIASYLDAPFTALGTDGFGRSDTRAALRRFFEVDRHHVALASLTALRVQGRLDAATCADAIARYGLSADAVPSWLA